MLVDQKYLWVVMNGLMYVGHESLTPNIKWLEAINKRLMNVWPEFIRSIMIALRYFSAIWARSIIYNQQANHYEDGSCERFVVKM